MFSVRSVANVNPFLARLTVISRSQVDVTVNGRAVKRLFPRDNGHPPPPPLYAAVGSVWLASGYR